MILHHSLAAALWLLTAVGAYALAASWADDAQSGKLHPWVLVIVFWAAALASVAIHHLSNYLAQGLAQGRDALKRYWVRSRPVVRAASGLLWRSWALHRPAAGAAAADMLRHIWGQSRPAASAVADLLKRCWPHHKATAGQA